MTSILYVPIALSIVGLLYMFARAQWVRKQDGGNEKMQAISKSIKEGALAFLHAEYRLLLIFVLIASGGLFAISSYVETTSVLIIPAFVVGAFFSAFAGVASSTLGALISSKDGRSASSIWC